MEAGSREQATRQALDRCVAERAFTLVYQPIIDLDTGDVTGAEVLCRFDDGTPPDRQFQAAETLGMAAELDLAIIDAALAELPDVAAGYVSLNLSPSTLRDPRLGDVLLAPRVSPHRIVIEVTERARITEYQKAEELIGRVRFVGVRLAVDDAGAGYATLRHMLKLRPDFIKMDRSITEDIDSDTARHVLATALVTFANAIGATVIAEGVETPGEIGGLRRAGISQGQGYLLGRPTTLPVAPSDYRPVAIPDAPGDAGGRRVVSNRALMGPPRPDVMDEEHPRSHARQKLYDALREVQSAESQLEDTVVLGRKAGLSWDEIAELVGMTRQGASKRFGQGRLH